MPNLRYLKFYFCKNARSCEVNLPSGLKSFSNRLSYLHWDGYPLESLPSTFCPQNLVELHMKGSHVRKLWDGIQDFVNLRRINLSRSSNLIKLPDFSKAQNLEKVDLSYCKKLCNVHPSLLSLHTLVTLNLYECSRLKSLKSGIHLKSLRDLDVSDCRSLKEFSLSSEKLTFLQLMSTKIEILHSSIGRLSKLESLFLDGSRLENLPIKEFSRLTSLEELVLRGSGQVIDEPNLHILFDGLRSLQYLSLERCSNLSTLPDNISNLLSLYKLELQGSSIENLPASIKHLPNLKKIDLSNCVRLKSLPELPPCLQHLDAKNCVSLETVFTSTTSILQKTKRGAYILSFQNCVKLDAHSFIMEFAQLSMKGAVYNNCGAINICYPGSIVPWWSGFEQTTGPSKRTITTEIAPTYRYLQRFLLCSVVSPGILIKNVQASLRCQCYLEDGETVKQVRKCGYPLGDQELYSNHVFLWTDEFCVGSTTYDYDRKLTFLFYCDGGGQLSDLNKFIRACGVCPIYESEYHNFVQQMELELGTKTKMPLVIDEQEQLPPTRQLKESSIGDPVPLRLELELGTKTKRPLDIEEQQQLPPTKKLKESSVVDPDALGLDLELGLVIKSKRSLNID